VRFKQFLEDGLVLEALNYGSPWLLLWCYVKGHISVLSLPTEHEGLK